MTRTRVEDVADGAFARAAREPVQIDAGVNAALPEFEPCGQWRCGAAGAGVVCVCDGDDGVVAVEVVPVAASPPPAASAAPPPAAMSPAAADARINLLVEIWASFRLRHRSTGG